MAVPTDRRYLKTHEWHQLADGIVTIGITRFAVDQLTDITYVELPRPGSVVRAGETFGEIESVKATSDLYSGVTGEVIEINEDLAGAPELVNSDPFGEGWMAKIKVSKPAEFEKLLTVAAYEAQLGH